MRRLRPILLVALAVAVASCGEDEAAAPAPPSASGSAASGFPVTVTHKLGGVTIEDEPKRESRSTSPAPTR